MAWIRTIPKDIADPKLAQLYEQAQDPRTGQLDNIMQIHSLHLAGLSAHLELYKAVMRGTRTLPAVEREMIALVVSKVNGCEY